MGMFKSNDPAAIAERARKEAEREKIAAEHQARAEEARQKLRPSTQHFWRGKPSVRPISLDAKGGLRPGLHAETRELASSAATISSRSPSSSRTSADTSSAWPACRLLHRARTPKTQ